MAGSTEPPFGDDVLANAIHELLVRMDEGKGIAEDSIVIERWRIKIVRKHASVVPGDPDREYDAQQLANAIRGWNPEAGELTLYVEMPEMPDGVYRDMLGIVTVTVEPAAE